MIWTESGCLFLPHGREFSGEPDHQVVRDRIARLDGREHDLSLRGEPLELESHKVPYKGPNLWRLLRSAKSF
jgi:hypothetical protein